MKWVKLVLNISINDKKHLVHLDCEICFSCLVNVHQVAAFPTTLLYTNGDSGHINMVYLSQVKIRNLHIARNRSMSKANVKVKQGKQRFELSPLLNSKRCLHGLQRVIVSLRILPFFFYLCTVITITKKCFNAPQFLFSSRRKL